MGKPIVHFEIGCRDMKKSSQFYADLLDWNMQEFGPATMIDTGGTEGITGHMTTLREASRLASRRVSISTMIHQDAGRRALIHSKRWVVRHAAAGTLRPTRIESSTACGSPAPLHLVDWGELCALPPHKEQWNGKADRPPGRTR